MKLTLYIHKYYSGSQAAFAKANKVKPQQVTKWINMDCVVFNNELYSKRRTLEVVK